MAFPARKLTTMTAAIALAFSVTVSLSGCFGNPIEDLVNKGVSEAIKGATGLDAEGGESIPSNFPSQVPLVSTDVVFGGSLKVDGKSTWTVTVKVDGAGAFEQIQSQLIGAGFEETLSTTDMGGMGVYTGHGLGIIVNMTDDDGANQATYIVNEDRD